MTILVSTDAWLDDLRTRLPGISEGQLSLELKSTLREFFTKSGFWLEEIEMTVVAHKQKYKLNYPQAQIMGVHNVWINGGGIGLTDVAPKRLTATANRASTAFMVEHDVLQLYPIPTDPAPDSVMKVRVRLNPLPEMCKVPTETVSHFFDEVMDGVLGRLFSQPGKPYTNVLISQYHLKRFRDGISMARDVARRRYSTAQQSWAFPQGWAGNNFRRGNGRSA